MPRPKRCRRVCSEPKYSYFDPEGIKNPECVILSVDEYEVIRLVDYEKLNHEQCAANMDISRTTVTEIYESARFKISDCIVNGKQLSISGGSYRICDGSQSVCYGKTCRKSEQNSKQNIVINADKPVKIAVTYDNGAIFPHFGHTGQFKVYEADKGIIKNSEVIDAEVNGHEGLTGLLSESGVDVLICGGIGGGAQRALADAGIKIYGGVSGNADEAVRSLINGTIEYSSGLPCVSHSREAGSGCGNLCRKKEDSADE